MIFHHVLDVAFATWSHIAVLRAMQDSAQGFTGREIARTAQMNHRSCLKALTTLEALAIVSRHRGGRDHLFTLNRNHLIVSEGILPLLKLEREFLDRVARVLRNHTVPPAESLILFGSVARKKENLQSDLDICFVVRSAADKRKVLERVREISPRVRKEFGANLAAIAITNREFSYRARTRKPLVSSILRDGVVIAGKRVSGAAND